MNECMVAYLTVKTISTAVRFQEKNHIRQQQSREASFTFAFPQLAFKEQHARGSVLGYSHQVQAKVILHGRSKVKRAKVTSSSRFCTRRLWIWESRRWDS